MQSLSERQLGWIGGIMDGEGHFGISVHRKKPHSEPTYHPKVAVTNTSMLMLTHLKRTTGIGTIIPTGEDGNSKRKDAWSWQLRVHEMRQFLPAILPYLVVKQTQAELVLEYLETVIPGNFAPVSPTVQGIRQGIYEELAELTRRGKRS